jgi:hypothetical protein
MRSFAAGKIDVYFGPKELGAADDFEQAIADFIDGAKSSLDVARRTSTACRQTERKDT